MDKRIFYYLLLDTETCNTIEQPFVFDIGGVVCDKRGKIYNEFSFIVREVFYDMPDLMKVCYYQSKLPQYRKDIKSGERIVANWYTIKHYIKRLCEVYDIKAIIAHNAAFDVRACCCTQRFITCSKDRYFFPYGVPIWDIMRMARDTICKQPTYKQFCNENGYITKNKRVKVTAEILYRYITCNTDFVEEHTALQDAKIEMEIFKKCMAQHKKMKKSPWGK